MRSPINSHERIWQNSVAFDVTPHKRMRTVRLCNIRALFPARGQGSEALRWLCGLADKHGVTIVGTAEPTGKMSLNKQQLKAWYKRNGFDTPFGDDIEYTPS
jgi:hypothetical protein